MLRAEIGIFHCIFRSASLSGLLSSRVTRQRSPLFLPLSNRLGITCSFVYPALLGVPLSEVTVAGIGQRKIG